MDPEHLLRTKLQISCMDALSGLVSMEPFLGQRSVRKVTALPLFCH